MAWSLPQNRRRAVLQSYNKQLPRTCPTENTAHYHALHSTLTVGPTASHVRLKLTFFIVFLTLSPTRLPVGVAVVVVFGVVAIINLFRSRFHIFQVSTLRSISIQAHVGKVASITGWLHAVRLPRQLYSLLGVTG